MFQPIAKPAHSKEKIYFLVHMSEQLLWTKAGFTNGRVHEVDLMCGLEVCKGRIVPMTNWPGPRSAMNVGDYGAEDQIVEQV